jgi:hypothetical protein
MPRIAEIDGIVVSINFDDHAPPHFHARYQRESVSIEIETGRVIGIMSRNQLNKVEQWRKNNLHDLRSKWKEFGGA